MLATWQRGGVEPGAGLRAVLEPLAKIRPLDRDLARFCRLDDELAAVELEQALSELPELRQAFAYRLLHTLMRAVVAGGGWAYGE